jgi:uncharacterized protein
VNRSTRDVRALAAFGVVAHAFFGFNVLLGYAVWGLPLSFVRRWSVRALLTAAVVSAISWNVYTAAQAAYVVSNRGEAAVREEMQARVAWFYAQPFSFLPVNTFTLFLFGVIGLRLGLFDEPGRHRGLIGGPIAFGVVSWAAAMGLYLIPPAITGGPMLRELILTRLQYGFGLVREMWLAFAYIGVVLLLVARNPRWVDRLSMFAWTGRMALTNYMIQIALLDLLFAKYALGLSATPLVGLTMAGALFAAGALFSRWWLARYQYGPLEWLWRSITYARWQPWRVVARRPVVVEELAATG